jgi:hypothetical protein
MAAPGESQGGFRADGAGDVSRRIGLSPNRDLNDCAVER